MPQVPRYHSFYPLEDLSKERNSKVFVYPTTIYKATNYSDGNVYSIRKIDGFRLAGEIPLTIADLWKEIQHPNIVTLREMFFNKNFSSSTGL